MYTHPGPSRIRLTWSEPDPSQWAFDNEDSLAASWLAQVSKCETFNVFLLAIIKIAITAFALIVFSLLRERSPKIVNVYYVIYDYVEPRYHDFSQWWSSLGDDPLTELTTRAWDNRVQWKNDFSSLLERFPEELYFRKNDLFIIWSSVLRSFFGFDLLSCFYIIAMFVDNVLSALQSYCSKQKLSQLWYQEIQPNQTNKNEASKDGNENQRPRMPGAMPPKTSSAPVTEPANTNEAHPAPDAQVQPLHDQSSSAVLDVPNLCLKPANHDESREAFITHLLDEETELAQALRGRIGRLEAENTPLRQEIQRLQEIITDQSTSLEATKTPDRKLRKTAIRNERTLNEARERASNWECMVSQGMVQAQKDLELARAHIDEKDRYQRNLQAEIVQERINTKRARYDLKEKNREYDWVRKLLRVEKQRNERLLQERDQAYKVYSNLFQRSIAKGQQFQITQQDWEQERAILQQSLRENDTKHDDVWRELERVSKELVNSPDRHTILEERAQVKKREAAVQEREFTVREAFDIMREREATVVHTYNSWVDRVEEDRQALRKCILKDLHTTKKLNRLQGAKSKLRDERDALQDENDELEEQNNRLGIQVEVLTAAATPLPDDEVDPALIPLPTSRRQSKDRGASTGEPQEPSQSASLDQQKQPGQAACSQGASTQKPKEADQSSVARKEANQNTSTRQQKTTGQGAPSKDASARQPKEADQAPVARQEELGQGASARKREGANQSTSINQQNATGQGAPGKDASSRQPKDALQGPSSQGASAKESKTTNQTTIGRQEGSEQGASKKDALDKRQKEAGQLSSSKHAKEITQGASNQGSSGEPQRQSGQDGSAEKPREAGRDASKKGISKKDTSKKDISKKDAPKKDTSKKDTSKKDTSKKDAPKKDAPKKESLLKGIFKKDASGMQQKEANQGPSSR